LSFQRLERFEGHVDVLVEQAKKRDANIASRPLNQPWNVRELTVLDPDGDQLVFTAPLNTNLGFDGVVKRAANEKRSWVRS